MTTNLSGSLSEFSLAEVLSLLGMGGRTARMQVTSSDAVGTVHLVDGRISSATANSARAGLLRSVVAALPVPADDLAQALASEEPVRALVESGVVDRDAAQQVASEHCTEAIGEMLDWTSGEFAVWVGSQDPGDIGVRLEVDQLVAAARERAQEWHDLRAALPGSDSVLALVADVEQAPVVDREDWSVLARVDGRRTLAEVLAAMGASPLAAGHRLVQLMGRGLVAVQVRGSDAEQEQASQMLDAFDSSGPFEPVIELVAPVAPEHEPDVHDLFVTEPEAVQEWQVAAADAWDLAHTDPVVDLPSEAVSYAEPVPAEEYSAPNEWPALVAPEFPAGPEPVMSQSFPAAVDATVPEAQPMGFDAATVTFDEAPVTFEEAPVTFDDGMHAYQPEPAPSESVAMDFAVPIDFAVAVDPQPEAEGVFESAVPTYDLEPEVQEAAVATFDLEPVAEQVGESFSWSPWAQEMGLGEAPPAVPAQPERFTAGGFADMVEEAAGPGHTDAFPVPHVPVAFAEPWQVAAEGTAVDEAAQFVPQPRDPGDGVVDPAEYAQHAGAHAAEAVDVPDAPVPVEAAGGQPESAPDPLAGGLLAHLMSSVRGL
jgi:hypothetical protein